MRTASQIPHGTFAGGEIEPGTFHMECPQDLIDVPDPTPVAAETEFDDDDDVVSSNS